MLEFIIALAAVWSAYQLTTICDEIKKGDKH
jgi:hypothetical protein